MASTVDLVVRIVTDTAKAAGDLKATGDKVGKFQSGIQKAALPAAAALAGLGAAAISAGNAAAEDAQAQAILQNTMEKTTGANSKAVSQMEDYIAATSKATGVTDDELRPAMGNLLRATKDASKSQDAMNQVLDISASTGKDVETVSQAVAKAYGGSTGSLKKLVPSLSDAAAESGDMNRIMAELADTTGGAAAKSAETTAGKMAIMQNSMGEAQEEIGSALLPALSALAGLLTTVATFAQEHPALFMGIAVAVGVLAASILALNVAVGVYTAVTTLAGSATVAAWVAALWPILAVVAAVALVVAAVVILWKKSETFRGIVLGVWGAIKSAAAATANAIKAAWNTAINAITGFFKSAKSTIDGVWSAVKTAAGAVADWVKNAWDRAVDAIGGFLTGFKTAADKVWDKVKDAITTVTDFLGDAWDAAIGIVTAAIQAWQGVANGIFGAVQTALGKVKGAFTGLGATVKAVMGDAKTWLIQTGKNIVAGLVEGINSVIHWVQSAVQALADKIPGWVKKRLGISSPSKVMAAIGKDISAGLVVGMDEGRSAVTDMAADIADTIGATMEKKIKSDKRAAKAARFAISKLSDEYKKLKDKLDQVAAKRTELAEATQTLEDLTNEQIRYAEAVKDSAAAWGSVTSAVLPEDVEMSAASLEAAMGARVTAVEDFARTIEGLRAAGLAQGAIDALVQAGVEGGAAQAAAIAAGGPEAIAAFNALQGRLEAAATALGASSAASMYDAGIQAQQGLVDGLTEELTGENGLEAKAAKLAQALADAIDAAIKKALKKFGKKGGGGGGGNNADTLSIPTAPNVVPFRAPGVRSRTVTGGASGAPVNITVNGAIDPEATARQIRRILAGHNRRIGVSA